MFSNELFQIQLFRRSVIIDFKINTQNYPSIDVCLATIVLIYIHVKMVLIAHVLRFPED